MPDDGAGQQVSLWDLPFSPVHSTLFHIHFPSFSSTLEISLLKPPKPVHSYTSLHRNSEERQRASSPGERATPVQVCTTAFANILEISIFRIQKLCKEQLITGASPTEKHGGDRKSKSYESRNTSVKCHIESQVHLNPMIVSVVPNGHISVVIYPLYNCGKCTMRAIKLEKCVNTKQVLNLELLVHEKCVVNPLSLYFKLNQRILSHFLLTVRITRFCFKYHTKSHITVDSFIYSILQYARVHQNVHRIINAWNELEHKKGSMANIKSIRMFAYGCAGQNKNSPLLGMCVVWLLKDAPVEIQSIQLIFPVPGHSYMPYDRVFGHLEKVIRKINVIVDPEDCLKIFEDYGQVTIGKDVDVYDWKSSLKDVMKPLNAWHFTFSEPKHLPNSKKVNDVGKLLEKHYGSKWRELEVLSSFKDALDSAVD
ncbi:hypothetical protein PR048_032954 [Dryococelus australis]|uniref:Uncharacterized protein n=1 Tax=Dryococelus australis TaxID=614101 RepID=A0ABQ9G4U9_9NEOP|nr:hypothetical protein PR048_032954 [Dryococelus australis]